MTSRRRIVVVIALPRSSLFGNVEQFHIRILKYGRDVVISRARLMRSPDVRNIEFKGSVERLTFTIALDSYTFPFSFYLSQHGNHDVIWNLIQLVQFVWRLHSDG